MSITKVDVDRLTPETRMSTNKIIYERGLTFPSRLQLVFNILSPIFRLLIGHLLDIFLNFLDCRPVLLRTRNSENFGSAHSFWGVPGALACLCVDEVALYATRARLDNFPVFGVERILGLFDNGFRG